MFDLGWTELLIVVVVAILVIGPKELPRALRSLGQWTSRARRMAGDFQRQFNEAIREADLEDVKDQVKSVGKIDPIGNLRKELTQVGSDIKKDLQKATKIEAPKAADAKSPAPAEASKTDVAKPATEGKPATPAVAEKPGATKPTPAPAEAASKAPAKTTKARKPATKKPAAKKAAPRKPAAKKSAATKTAAPKTATPKRATTRKPASGGTAAAKAKGANGAAKPSEPAAKPAEPVVSAGDAET